MAQLPTASCKTCCYGLKSFLILIKSGNIIGALVIVLGTFYYNFQTSSFFALPRDDAPWTSTCAANTVIFSFILSSMTATNPDSFPHRTSYFASKRFSATTFYILCSLYSDLHTRKSVVCILQSKCCNKRHKNVLLTQVRGWYLRKLWLRVKGEHTGLVGARSEAKSSTCQKKTYILVVSLIVLNSRYKLKESQVLAEWTPL